MRPRNQIPTDRVPPAHMPPFISGRVELIEKVKLTVAKDQSIWIVHPVLGWRKVKLWSEGLSIVNVAGQGFHSRRPLEFEFSLSCVEVPTQGCRWISEKNGRRQGRHVAGNEARVERHLLR